MHCRGNPFPVPTWLPALTSLLAPLRVCARASLSRSGGCATEPKPCDCAKNLRAACGGRRPAFFRSASSRQSPLRSERPAGEGIPHFVSLPLLSPTNPLRWASLGTPPPATHAFALPCHAPHPPRRRLSPCDCAKNLQAACGGRRFPVFRSASGLTRLLTGAARFPVTLRRLCDGA